MESKIWGPPTWFFLHTLTFNYPDKPSYKDKSNYYDFFNKLQYILPCDICQKNYQKHLKEYPISPYLDSKKTLVEWLVHIHNLVNKDNNKPLLTSSEVIKKYRNIYISGENYCHDYCRQVEKLKKEPSSKIKISKITKIIAIILTLLLLVIIIFLLHRNYQLHLKIKKMSLI